MLFLASCCKVFLSLSNSSDASLQEAGGECQPVAREVGLVECAKPSLRTERDKAKASSPPLRPVVHLCSGGESSKV